MQRGVLTTAERTGLLLAVLENLYDYGPTGGKPMTEDLPLAAATVKGWTRAGVGLLRPGRRPGVSCLPGGSVRGPRDV